MECPVCKIPLRIAERQGIEIDYCPTCRGVWLDRGELDKIIERSAAYSEPSPWQRTEARPEAHHGHDQTRQRHSEKRRKGGLAAFLEDIFD